MYREDYVKLYTFSIDARCLFSCLCHIQYTYLLGWLGLFLWEEQPYIVYVSIINTSLYGTCSNYYVG